MRELRLSNAIAVAIAFLAGCSDESGLQGAASTSSSGSGGSADGPGANLACPPGELSRPDGSCQPPGVPADACGAGFEPDGSGGCDPVLPAAACDPGRMALPGDTACHAVAACAAGKWGDIPVTASTRFVDAGYTGGASAGTQADPWTTIHDALVSAIAPGTVVAIAAGDYPEDVVLDKPVSLWGVCPEDVHLAGPTTGIQVPSGTNGAEIHHLSLTSAGMGVSIAGSDVVIDGVWIHDTGTFGIFTSDTGGPAEVTIRSSLVEKARDGGVITSGSSVTFEDSVVRATQPSTDGAFGRGMSFEFDPQTGRRATGQLRRSVIDANRDIGVLALGADVHIEDSVVRQTLSRVSDKLEGTGVAAALYGTERANLRMSGSVVEHSHLCGLCGYDSELDVDTTTLRDIEAQDADGWGGFGLRIQAAGTEAQRPQLSLRRSIVARGRQVGIATVGADATVDSIIVTDTQPRAADDLLGRGISVEVGEVKDGSTLTLRGSRIEKSREVGVLVLGSQATIESILVTDTLSSAKDGRYGFGIGYLADVLDSQLSSAGTLRSSVVAGARMAGVVVAGADVSVADVVVKGTLPQGDGTDFGDGIIASSYLYQPKLYPTKLDVLHANVEDNARAGVASFGAAVSVGSTQLECNKIALDGEAVEGADFGFTDTGNNACACGTATAICKVLSSGLEPPLGLAN